MLQRAPSVQQFWLQNQGSFEDARKQWAASETQQLNILTFAPGTVLIHHGSVVHEFLPIIEGEESNLFCGYTANLDKFQGQV